MKLAAIIINFLIPGVGSMMIGRVGTGIIQLILYGLGALLALTGILWIVGAPICLVVLIWSLITAARYKEPPEKIIVVER